MGQIPSKQVLNRLYWVKGLSIRKIAKFCGIGYNHVWHALKDYAIPRRKNRSHHNLVGKCAVCSPDECHFKAWLKVSAETLNRLYWFEGLSTRQIAKRYGVNRIAVWYAMKRNNIPRRISGPNHRRSGRCIECGIAVCRIRVWTYAARGYVWRRSNRCAVHQILVTRKRKRDEKRRSRGTPADRWYQPQQRPFVSQWVRSE